jgi:hypothetical protein
MLLLFACPACSISPLGAVNVRNRFELLRPDLCCLKSLTGQHSAGVVAKLQNETRVVKRGIEHDLEVSVLVPQSRLDLVPGFRQVITMLEFSKTNVVQKMDEMPRPQNPLRCQQARKVRFRSQLLVLNLYDGRDLTD